MGNYACGFGIELRKWVCVLTNYEWLTEIEIQRYRALGTVRQVEDFIADWRKYRELGNLEELREAREKQMAKKPILNKTMNIYFCPVCERRVNHAHSMFCSGCGQAINWD